MQSRRAGEREGERRSERGHLDVDLAITGEDAGDVKPSENVLARVLLRRYKPAFGFRV